MTFPDTQDLVFDPIAAGAAAQEFTDYVLEIKRTTGTAGVPYGIKRLDQVLLPLLPIELRAHVALSGHTKTASLLRLSRWWAHIIAKSGRQGEAVAYVTYETPIEGIGQFLAASAVGIDIENMARGTLTDDERRRIETYNNVDRKRLPLFLVGKSFKRSKTGARMPLTVDNTWNALGYLQDAYGVKLVYVVVDYLQAAEVPADMSKRSGDNLSQSVGANLVAFKNMNIGMRCAVDLGAQAKTEVARRDHPWPDQYDIQWAFNSHQVPDAIISHNRPIKWGPEKRAMWEYIREQFGFDINEPGQRKAIGNLVTTKVCKQRNGRAGDIVAYMLDPRYNHVDELEALYYQDRKPAYAQVRPAQPEDDDADVGGAGDEPAG